MNHTPHHNRTPSVVAAIAATARPHHRGRTVINARTWALATALPLLAAAALLATAAPRVHAQTTAPAAAADWADAEVRKVDRESSKLTLKHGEIKSLDMPPMTMVFVARDKAMLEGLQPGSKIRFRAGKDKGQYTVLELQKAP